MPSNQDKNAINKRWRDSKSGKAYQERNREKLWARANLWIKTHRSSVNATKRRHWAKNRQRLQLAARLRRQKKIDQYRLADRNRYLRDREKRILSSLAVRAKRAKVEGVITLEQCHQLLKDFHFLCAYCRTQLLTANKSYDHKIPLSKGGTHSIENLVPACRSCNSRKHTRTDEEFFVWLSHIQT